MMSELEYVVLYTGQKTKKAKTWHDGTLKLQSAGSKAVLYDDKKSRLDTVFVRPADVVPGEQIESDRYFILIEEKVSGQQSQTVVQPSPAIPTSANRLATTARTAPVLTSGRGPGGLKRKKTGFVPPRVTKPAEVPRPDNYVEPARLESTKDVSPLHGMSAYRSSLAKLSTWKPGADSTVPTHNDNSRRGGGALRHFIDASSAQNETTMSAIHGKCDTPNNSFSGCNDPASANVASVNTLRTFETSKGKTFPESDNKEKMRGSSGFDPDLSGRRYPGSESQSTSSDRINDVSPDLSSFLSKLRNSNSESSTTLPQDGPVKKSSPWTTFGLKKFRSDSQDSKSNESSPDLSKVQPPSINVKRNIVEDGFPNIAMDTGNEDVRKTLAAVTEIQGLDKTDKKSDGGKKRTANQIMALLKGKTQKPENTYNQNNLRQEPMSGLRKEDESRNVIKTDDRGGPRFSIGNTSSYKEEDISFHLSDSVLYDRKHGESTPQGETVSTDLVEHQELDLEMERKPDPFPNVQKDHANSDYNLENNEFPEALNSNVENMDCVEGESDFQSEEFNAKDQFPYETSFDINFSPLSNVSLSDDEETNQRDPTVDKHTEINDNVETDNDSQLNENFNEGKFPDCTPKERNLEDVFSGGTLNKHNASTCTLSSGDMLENSGEVDDRRSLQVQGKEKSDTDYIPDFTSTFDTMPDTPHPLLSSQEDTAAKVPEVVQSEDMIEDQCADSELLVPPVNDNNYDEAKPFDSSQDCLAGVQSPQEISHISQNQRVTADHQSILNSEGINPDLNLQDAEGTCDPVDAEDKLSVRDKIIHDFASTNSANSLVACDAPIGSTRKGIHDVSISPDIAGDRPLDDLQFSPDSSGLSVSLSQSGFLGKLTAASRNVKTNSSIEIPIVGTHKRGSAFDDKPVRQCFRLETMTSSLLEEKCLDIDSKCRDNFESEMLDNKEGKISKANQFSQNLLPQNEAIDQSIKEELSTTDCKDDIERMFTSENEWDSQNSVPSVNTPLSSGASSFIPPKDSHNQMFANREIENFSLCPNDMSDGRIQRDFQSQGSCILEDLHVPCDPLDGNKHPDTFTSHSDNFKSHGVTSHFPSQDSSTSACSGDEPFDAAQGHIEYPSHPNMITSHPEMITSLPDTITLHGVRRGFRDSRDDKVSVMKHEQDHEDMTASDYRHDRRELLSHHQQGLGSSHQQPQLSLSSLPHPKQLKRGREMKVEQRSAVSENTLVQQPSNYLDSYTIKGMVAGTAARRSVSHPNFEPPSHTNVKVTRRDNPYTTGNVQEALEFVKDRHISTGHFDRYQNSNRNFEIDFGCPKVNSDSFEMNTFRMKPKTIGISNIRDEAHMMEVKTDSDMEGRDSQWLIHDSQSSSSSSSSFDPRFTQKRPDVLSYPRREPLQQLQSDSSQETEENFYIDWNRGKPKLLAGEPPHAHKHMRYTHASQHVPASPPVELPSPDLHPLPSQTVPQTGEQSPPDVKGCPPWQSTLRAPTSSTIVPPSIPRRPLKTDPDDMLKTETERHHAKDTQPVTMGKPSSIFHLQHNESYDLSDSILALPDFDSQSQDDIQTNHLEEHPLHSQRLPHELPNANNSSTISSLRLRMPTYDPVGDSVSSTQLTSTMSTQARFHRFTGKVGWQQKQLEEESQRSLSSRQEQRKDVRDDSRWGKFLQNDDDTDMTRSNQIQKIQSIDSSSEFSQKPQNHISGGRDRTFEAQVSNSVDMPQFSTTIAAPILIDDSRCSNQQSAKIHVVSPTVSDIDYINSQINFDDSFGDSDSHSLKTSISEVTAPVKNHNSSSVQQGSTFSSPIVKANLTESSSISPDVFQSEGTERRSISSKFTKPIFLNVPATPNVISPQCTPISQTVLTKKGAQFKAPMITSFSDSVLQGSQRNLCSELQFPPQGEVDANVTPIRQVRIPDRFPNVNSYKMVITAAVKEHLNIMLFELAKLYHNCMAKVDITKYEQTDRSRSNEPAKSSNPPCQCGVPSKMVQVKKEGSNKGRMFYACQAPRNQQCKYFQWADQSGGSSSTKGGGGGMKRMSLMSADSITAFVRGHSVTFYCECQFQLKHRDNYKESFKKNIPAWVRQKYGETRKKCMYIKLGKKDASSYYGRDDLWVVSKTLTFDLGTTFVARSSYFGPNSNNEVEVEPVHGYSPSNWTNYDTCHAILAGNASMELGCLVNLDEHVQLATLPILSHLLDRIPSDLQSNNLANMTKLCTPGQFVDDLAESYIQEYKLNCDQSEALRRVAAMMNKDYTAVDPVLLIHGVFGAGKSFLLSVLIKFLVDVFAKNDTYTPDVPFPWKLLISSTTNVAVDRVLLGLLDLGFEDFIRVGSVKKIAKPVLPYSVHASGSDSQELKDLQQMLRSDIPPSEKQLVRRSIEKHRLGENKKKLGGVRVVGVTCAAASFNCLNTIHFPFVVLDECSQMTEPASLLPIAKFSCEKLVLVGDPKQLDPTIQGSEAAHREGLEQTLFDRMIKLGYSPVMLRTQYRCHPWISHISNSLFYNGQLQDGISLEDRQPLSPVFPTLCFYDVTVGTEQSDGSGSYYNVSEADLVVLLIKALVLEGIEAGRIGVITLYKSQMYKIITCLHTDNADLNKMLKGVEVSTVDAFQGGERDAIILSCVRTNNIGFIDNDKRTNVALTRARHHLLITGNQRNLSRNKLWSQVLHHCQDRPRGFQSYASVTRELEALVLERLSQGSEGRSSQGSGQGSSQENSKRKRRKRKVKDSPPMDLSDDNTENSGQSVQIVSQSSDKATVPGPVTHEEDMDDFVLTEHNNNLCVARTRKRPRRSHLIDPDALVGPESSDEDDLPTFV